MRHKKTFWNDENVLYADMALIILIKHICKNLMNYTLNMVCFILHGLYLYKVDAKGIFSDKQNQMEKE